MKHLSSCFSVSHCRHHGIVWIVLLAVWWSWLPSASIAQQPTATLVTVTGTVLVSDQPVTIGTVLQAGDTIQTQAGASVEVEFSDKSVIQISENTQVTISELTRTSANVRTSRLKLIYGRLRALLSADHQAKGSAFTIDTPNALIGVKFSQPDVEVSYDPEKQETIGIAHTVELIASNLLTNEQIVVPVGASVVIIGLIMKVMAGTTAAAIAAEVASAEASAAATGATTAGTATGSGIGTGTMIALGVGVAAAGGVVAVVASSDSGGDGSSSEQSYNVSDLQGSWTLSFVLNTGLARGGLLGFDAQGTIVDFSGPANLMSYTGSLTVSANGSVEGSVTWQAGYDPEQVPCFGYVSTTTMNFQGEFLAQNTIEGTLTWSDTSTCPTESPVSGTGTFTMTR